MQDKNLKMDECELDSRASLSLISRHRSPTFKQAEVKALLELIRKHKNIILNKATNSAANHAKGRVWTIIAKELNKLRLGPERSAEVLRTKWENLKRCTKKMSNDLLDVDCDFTRDEIAKTITLIFDENRMNEQDDQDISLKSFIGCEDKGDDLKIWASEDEDNSAVFDIDDAADTNQKKTHNKCKVSSGFSPEECRVLLQCVRQEKKVLFSDTSLFKRQQAWKRIAETYNKQSPRKKTSRELSKKFNNLKLMAKRININGFFKEKKSKMYEQLCDDSTSLLEKVKTEPIVDRLHFEFDSEDDLVLNNPVDSTNDDRLGFVQDPLNGAHGSNSDSGLGSISDTKDASRLKLELLNYKMETARLERKRVEDAIRGEQEERELRALEQSLRLRAARLELAAAEAKLPGLSPGTPRHTT